ncbi:DUF1015 family protein [Actinomadura sp. 3N508]|uniref:DUF1015 family protein n=1 Tax=Actinomadura sp. 3N508 TaxID=3375153 RepID=UPI0037A8C6B2
MFNPIDDQRMALAPFRGVRYCPTAVPDLGAVTCPPLDLLEAGASARLLAAEPRNAVQLLLPNAGPGAPDRYQHAALTLRQWLTDRTLITDTEPALYVYEQRTAQGVLQRGLIGALALQEDSTRIICPHEDVFPDLVHDRLAFVEAIQANLEPILLLYQGDGCASQVVDDIADNSEPLFTAKVAHRVAHRVWRLTDRTRLSTIADDLAGQRMLIADGHHRYRAYQMLRSRRPSGVGAPWNRGLALLVDSLRHPPRLGAIHRVIARLTPDDAINAAKPIFQVRQVLADDALDELASASRLGPAFLIAGDGRYHILTGPDPAALNQAMPPSRSARWRRLDTSVLHHLLIDHIWNCPENTVAMVHHDVDTAIEQARRRAGTAVILNPLNVPDVLDVAAGGEFLPRKSTSFGPKPCTGLIFRTFASELPSCPSTPSRPGSAT